MTFWNRDLRETISSYPVRKVRMSPWGSLQCICMMVLQAVSMQLYEGSTRLNTWVGWVRPSILISASVLKKVMNFAASIVADMITSLNLHFLSWSLCLSTAIRTSVLILLSWASSRINRSQLTPIINSLTAMPSVTKTTLVLADWASSNRTLQPTSCPTSTPISLATLLASVMALILLGCETTIRLKFGARYWGTWVVLPLPVSPHMTVTLFFSTVCLMASAWAWMGKVGVFGYSSIWLQLMNKQFNTFANSPNFAYSPPGQSAALALSSQHSLHSPRPVASSSTPAALNDSMDSKVSMLLSEATVPTAQANAITPARLYNLENYITKEMLELREQKISLMQELSRHIDEKNLYQHYLQLEEQEKENPKPVPEGIVPLDISGPILEQNQRLHLQLKELQIKAEIFGPESEAAPQEEEDQQLVEEIVKVRQMNAGLRNQLSQRLKTTSEQNASQSRFVTFLPQDKHLHQADSQQDVLQDLKAQHKQLKELARQQTPVLTSAQAAALRALEKQNSELQAQADAMLRQRGQGDIADLQRRIEQNQKEKVIFMEELEKFKNRLGNLKAENERLKRQLGR